MYKILEIIPPKIRIEKEGKIYAGTFVVDSNFIDLHFSFGHFRLENPSSKKRRSSSTAHEGGLTAPMPGKVVKVLVTEESSVKKGDVLLILEAMKMEQKIVSPKEGIIKKIRYKEGDRVSQGEELIEIV